MMKDNSFNIEFEKKIENYLQGKLTTGEIDELWAEILREPEYLGHLKTEAQLAAYFKIKKTAQAEERNKFRYRSFMISMAAVVVLAIGLLWSLIQQRAPSYPQPIADISYVEMETPAVTRSDTEQVDESVFMILEAYDLILDSNETEAVALFREITSIYADSESATLSWLNLGIIAYNNNEYESSVRLFETASVRTNIDEMVRQKAYWFMANAAYKAGDLEKASSASQLASEMEGYYTGQAADFYEQLNAEMNRR